VDKDILKKQIPIDWQGTILNFWTIKCGKCVKLTRSLALNHQKNRSFVLIIETHPSVVKHKAKNTEQCLQRTSETLLKFKIMYGLLSQNFTII
jgi:thiol-disulfide isomerase/thioredoxin